MTAKSNHKFFTASGITARFLIFVAQKVGEPHDVVASAAFGIVEILGAKRFYQILGKAVKHQLKEFMRANSNAKRRARVSQASEKVSRPS